jgi:Fe2+ or Zn2+ uptake regulation protein
MIRRSRGQRLSDIEKIDIVREKNNSLATPKTHSQIAEKCGTSRKTVGKVLKLFSENRVLFSPKHPQTRTFRKLTFQHLQLFDAILTEHDGNISISNLYARFREKSGVEVSIRTVRRAIFYIGWHKIRRGQ